MRSLFHSPAIHLGLSMHEFGAAGSDSCCTDCPIRSTIRHLPGSASCIAAESSPLRLPISVPPTSLDECFFFISLVVRLPCSSIFCQFWLFFVFKLLLSFFWLCEEAQCVYLHLHLGQKLRFLSFCQSLLACKVSFQKSTDSLMGTPL